MTEQAQQIAIAEVCPCIYSDDGEWCWQDAKGNWHDCFANDPLRDLNAMHEAENTALSEEVWPEYGDNLRTVMHGSFRPTWHATAAQRAEAFLRTLNLWDDTK